MLQPRFKRLIPLFANHTWLEQPDDLIRTSQLKCLSVKVLQLRLPFNPCLCRHAMRKQWDKHRDTIIAEYKDQRELL
jgi:hypothetical protein